MASARRTKQSAQAEATPSRLTHLALLTAAFALLALPAFEIGFLQWRLLPSRLIAFVIGVVLEALGWDLRCGRAFTLGSTGAAPSISSLSTN